MGPELGILFVHNREFLCRRIIGLISGGLVEIMIPEWLLVWHQRLSLLEQNLGHGDADKDMDWLVAVVAAKIQKLFVGEMIIQEVITGIGRGRILFPEFDRLSRHDRINTDGVNAQLRIEARSSRALNWS